MNHTFILLKHDSPVSCFKINIEIIKINNKVKLIVNFTYVIKTSRSLYDENNLLYFTHDDKILNLVLYLVNEPLTFLSATTKQALNAPVARSHCVFCHSRPTQK